MPIPDHLIEQARNADLLTYLQSQGYQLTNKHPNEHRLVEHDSLVISNNLWHWFSRNIGGNTLDFLTKYEGKPFRDAVFELTEKKAPSKTAQKKPPPQPLTQLREKKTLQVLPPVPDNARVFSYLQGRGIHPKIIQHCIDEVVLYSDQRNNVVFIGNDNDCIPRYAALRSMTSDYKGDAPGSDKRYGFSLQPDTPSKNLYVFESPIDALSFITLEFPDEQLKSHYLALGGVSPLALEQYLSDHAEINTVFLCLDNDPPGREATAKFKNMLWEKGYTVHDLPPGRGKDYNEYLTAPFQGLFSGREHTSRPVQSERTR